MKLLFVHERFGAFGGAEANILLTGRELKRRGHDLALLHGPSSGRGENEWRETFSLAYPLAMKNPRDSLAGALRDFQPDVVYVHKIPELGIIEGLATSGRPVVRMVHDHDLYCMRSYKYRVFTRKICRRAASPFCVFPCGAFVGKNSAGVWPLRWISYRAKKKEMALHHQFQRLVVASHYMKEELLRNGFEEEQIKILAPVPQAMKAGPTSSFSSRNWIIYAGQVIRGKGVDVLLQSLARVEVPFQCLVFGDGNHLPACRGLSRKLGLAERVQFHGFVPQPQLAQYYQEASVAVLSSLWPEPFGAVGLEAMSFGLPVVAFDVGGVREWLISAYNGFLVPWMDREAFAARVQQLLVDKALGRQMGQRGQRLITQKYDFGNYISGLENLFQEVRTENREKIAA